MLARKPEYSPAVAICVEAWHDLSTERPMAIASGTSGQTHWTRVQHGPIPWSAVMAWCDRSDLDSDNAAMVWSVIRHLDGLRMLRESSERRLNGGV